MGEGEGTSAEVTEAEEDYEDDDEAYPGISTTIRHIYYGLCFNQALKLIIDSRDQICARTRNLAPNYIIFIVKVT